jgi:TPR repeat protein
MRIHRIYNTVLNNSLNPMTKALLTPPTSLDMVNALAPEAWHAVISGDSIAAAQWMLHCAQLGHADAQAILGQWLLDGRGLACNRVDALAWFLKAAAQGQSMGMNMAGRCFENGWGVVADNFVAANWYRQAADQGLDAGMYNYANLLAAGKGVRQDSAAALGWYRKAAAQGHAKSMTKIGHFYEDGRVVAQDTAAAMQWFEGGARGGDFRGQFNYAGMLAVAGRMEEALQWLQKVPLTATPGFKQLAGAQLLQSPHSAFRDVGQTMLKSLTLPTPDALVQP